MDRGSGSVFEKDTGHKEYEKRIMYMHVFWSYIGP
jgi:hypothetical protein